jgi:predicted permease
MPARSQWKRDLDDEIDFHISQSMRELMAAGMPEKEALERSRARFGDERAYRAALQRIDGRRIRMSESEETMDAIVRTLDYAVRGVRRNPGFALSIVVILSLGIGANAVMFGVVDRLLLSPPQHVVDAEDVRLLYVRRGDDRDEGTTVGQTITHPDYLDFRSVGAFAGVAAYHGPQDMTVGRGEEAARARVASASPSLFGVLGVRPAVGRFFSEADDEAGAEPTAILAHEYWERVHGRADVLGRRIDVGQGSYTVIGIAPAGFTGAALEPVDMWLPLTVSETIESGERWRGNRGSYWVHTVARLAPGASVEAAQAEATAAHRAGRAEQIEQERYDADAEVIVAPIITAHGPRPTGEAQVARWLAGVSLIVLLIACLNAANLLLARAIRARRETAVRLALGVSRRRLMSELVAESVTLAMLGAGAALVLAYALSGPVHQILLPNVAFTDTGLGGRLLRFTGVAALAAGLLAGLIPARSASKADLAEALKAGGRGVAGGRSRARVALLIGQAALSVVLLVGAGLFVRSLRAASELDLGFDTGGVVVVDLQWNESLSGEERHAIVQRALSGIRRLPAVHSAGLTWTVPFRSTFGMGQPRVPGMDSIPRHRSGGPYVNKVGSGYFDALGLTILQGRGFEPADDAERSPTVAVVSESMARAIWPNGDALGACMLVGDAGDYDADEVPCTEIVGVVENHRRQDLVEDDPHFLYFLNQHHPALGALPQAIMAGVTGPAGAAMALLRDEAAGTSSQIRFVNVVPLRDRIEPQLRSWRLGASMFTAFGVLALIVAGWGLYSVLAFDVALRHHELGIRSALGAGATTLVGLVLRRALALIVAGTAIGLVASWVAGRWVEPLLFEVSATDPSVYVLVCVVLLAVAALAGSLPAWRASGVDPREALQTD